jgi:putative spermidine/putrescine transport system permease protein
MSGSLPGAAATPSLAKPRSAKADDARAAGRDLRPLLVLPGLAVVVALFLYPFLYGLFLSFEPLEGGAFANYIRFFSEPRLYGTIGTTLWLSLPITLLNVGLALPVAYALRVPSTSQRIITTILVVPITLGTVLAAQGLLSYLSPQGWMNRALLDIGLIAEPIRLLHKPAAVIISLVITGFPFAFLMMLSYVTGIDPTLARAAATLGAPAHRQFFRIYLPLLAPGIAITFALCFVQAFAVFPSAVMLGAPAGPTRVISIAAYEAAFEEYDYSLASAIALIMGAVQLGVVALVLGLRNLAYRGPAASGKG